MIGTLCSALVLFLSLTHPGTDEVTAQSINENVLVLTVTKGFWQVNGSAVSTDGGVIVIDTFNLPDFALQAKRKIREFTDKPIRYVINSHCHTDHAFGNAVFDDAVIIGHSKCGEELIGELERIKLEDPIRSFEKMSATAKPGSEKANRIDDMLDFLRRLNTLFNSGFKPTPPDIEFENAAILSVGGTTFELIYTGPVHSATDIAIYVPKEKVLFTSDLFHPDSIPAFKADTMPHPTRLRKVFKLLLESCGDANYVVPGHGRICSISDLKAQEAYLTELDAALQKAWDSGLSLEQAKSKVHLEDFLSYDNYKAVHQANIEEWWKIKKH